MTLEGFIIGMSFAVGLLIVGNLLGHWGVEGHKKSSSTLIREKTKHH